MRNRFLTKQLFALTLLTACVVTPAAYAQQPAAPQSPAQPAAQSEAVAPRHPASEPFLRTELFFGNDKPDGSEISKDEFRKFLKEEITTRFPDGLTVLSGTGQFRDSENDKIIR